MEHILRKDGFIDLNELGKSPYFQNIQWKNYLSMLNEYGHSTIRYIFKYKNNVYFYKTPDSVYHCYLELVACELARLFPIPAADYDLAYSHRYGYGVISKSFKQKGYHYIKGYEILADYIKNCLYKMNLSIEDYEIENEIEKYNSLEGIRAAFEYRYRHHPNRENLVNTLMNQFVDIFIFDILTGQTDRHEENWGIASNENEIILQPLFDNEKILNTGNDFRFNTRITNPISSCTTFQEGIKLLLFDFLTYSSPEFILKFKSKVSLIGENNIKLVLYYIETKTKFPIPVHIREKIIQNFKTMETIILSTLTEYEENRKLR